LASELGGSQISTLLEALPGIANVLRSPVADALLNVIRAGARIAEFQVADADELVKYAVRRGLVGAEEGDRVLQEIHEANQRRAEKAEARGRMVKTKPAKHKPKAKALRKPAKKRR
jgi:polyhydroxyalkanoate synthesis regulator phasin